MNSTPWGNDYGVTGSKSRREFYFLIFVLREGGGCTLSDIAVSSVFFVEAVPRMCSIFVSQLFPLDMIYSVGMCVRVNGVPRAHSLGRVSYASVFCWW